MTEHYWIYLAGFLAWPISHGLMFWIVYPINRYIDERSYASAKRMLANATFKIGGQDAELKYWLSLMGEQLEEIKKQHLTNNN